MKILFFNYEYPPLGGGAANATFCILNEFSKMPGISVNLVTSSIDEKYHIEEVGENVRVHRLPIGKNPKNLHFQSQKDLLLYTWKAYWFSKRLCRENKFDVAISFFTVPCGFISLLLKNKFKLPYIVSLRGSDVPGYSDRFPLIYAFLKPIFRLIWKKAAAVISNSRGLKELALKTNPNQKIDIIYNGIDTNKFYPDEARRDKKHFIITPGASRITDRKGLIYLIEAVNELKEKYPQIILEIMGEGNAKEKLKKTVKDLNMNEKVKFLGRIPREETFSYYQKASVFVLPSFNEGMSNAMLEALASGLPILATPTGGSDELVQDGKNGFILKMKNSDDIAEKIVRIVENDALRKEMSSESRNLAEKMSWKNVAEEYMKISKNIIECSR